MKRIKFLRHIFKFRGFTESLRLAGIGIAYLFRYHRNMRIIFLAGACVFALGLYFQLRGMELAVLCITITIVFVAEIFNTAIELLLDMHTGKYRTLIKLVKDISAAVVLLASLNAIAVGWVIFYGKIFK